MRDILWESKKNYVRVELYRSLKRTRVVLYRSVKYVRMVQYRSLKLGSILKIKKLLFALLVWRLHFGGALIN